KHNIMFETVPSEDLGEGKLRATRTVLTVYCQDGEPWRLEHRQFRVSKQLAWSPGTCGTTEISVYVGSNAEDERPLDPLVSKGPMGLLTLFKSAERKGNEFSWKLAGNAGSVAATYVITLPENLLALANGVKPPASILQ